MRDAALGVGFAAGARRGPLVVFVADVLELVDVSRDGPRGGVGAVLRFKAALGFEGFVTVFRGAGNVVEVGEVERLVDFGEFWLLCWGGAGCRAFLVQVLRTENKYSPIT